ncbi:MAG: M4 family metallopeptidase [Chthoniobacterales bacterium]
MKRHACLIPLIISASAIALFPGAAEAQQNTSQVPSQAPQPASIQQASGQVALSERQARVRTISYNHLAEAIGRHGIGDVNELRTLRVVEDDDSMTHTHVQQTHRGVPVFGGEAIVHLNADESLSDITDDFVSFVTVNTEPTLSVKDATKAAVRKYGCSECLTAKAEVDLWVLRQNGRDHLVYRVQLRREDGSAKTALPIYFIDAHSGDELWSYNNLQSATGTGVSLYSGTRTINTYRKRTNPYAGFYLEDHARNIGTYDNNNTETTTYNFFDKNNTWNSARQRAAIDAHFGTAKVWDYYKNVHNRRGLDGAGGPVWYGSINGTRALICTRVHFGANFNNGYFDGTAVVNLGDGDGTINGPNVSLDWLGHEWTHALTRYTANLIYDKETGALNESWSDVFGCMIERYVKGENAATWSIFEQTLTPLIAGDAERYMDTPHKGRDHNFTINDQPDHYTERYLGTEDNGGVHVNSGIPNKVFYLVARGGAHHLGGSMNGIGPDVAAKIWYKALTGYMTSTTKFAGARAATLKAAAALHGAGSPEQNAVRRAWNLCGVN